MRFLFAGIKKGACNDSLMDYASVEMIISDQLIRALATHHPVN